VLVQRRRCPMMRPMFAVRLASLAFLGSLLCIACSGPGSESYELDNGVVVKVSSTGRIRLYQGERELWAMAAGEAFTLRTFDEETLGALGIWEFKRSASEEVALNNRSAFEASESLVQFEISGKGRGALVEVRSEGPDKTRVRFTLEGDVDAEADALAVPVACGEEASFLGFGEQYNATNQRGEAFSLFVSEQGIGRVGGPRVLTGDLHTSYFPMPYYLDAMGTGVLLETDRRVEVDLCKSNPDVAWLEVVDSRPLELVVFHGPTPKDVISQLGTHIGRPAKPPEWGYQLWISAQGGRDAVMAEVDALAAADIPFGVVWTQDWSGERLNADGGKGVEYRWEVDDERYPNLEEMIGILHDRGIRFLAYANPFVDPALPNHFEFMKDKGMLIMDEAGETYVTNAPNGRASQPDFTNPQTRDYVQTAFRNMIEDHGIDGFMADFGEWLPMDAVLSDGTSGLDAHNIYPIEWHRMWREVMEDLRPGGDYAVIARSGWTGVHAYSQIHWIGDQETSFSETDGLPTVVPAMINLGLSGIPYVTHDIAGFSSHEAPSTKELFMRWTELGAFTPIMRTHEGAFRDENWAWDSDAETTDHFRRFVNVHDALAPELAQWAEEAQVDSVPLVRHMLLEFPDDPQVVELSEQYMLGPELLVAPVVREAAVTRDVYLPAGTWFHVWSGQQFAGPTRVVVDAPLGQPPVFSLERDREDLRAIE